jgi:DNA-binding beta-propeller fold protein YncE
VRLDEELHHVLREGVSGIGASEEAWNAIERRLERQASGRSGRRFAVAALALSVSAASLIGLWLAFRSAPTDRLGGEHIDLDPRVTAVVPVGPFPGDLAVGEGAVWVGVPAQPPNQDRQLIVRIDAATNEIVARIPMDDYVEELAAGEGAVWGNAVAGTAADPVFSIVRIDPATNKVVATIQDVSGPLAVGEGALWAVDRAGARAGPDGSTLLRIDPSTNRVAARIPLGVALWDIEVGEGYVWVLTFEPNQGDGDILQVDPRTNEVVARIDIPVPGSVFAPALGEGTAWVPVCCIDNRQVLVRVDAKTHRIVGEPIQVEAAAPFAAAAGHVWLFGERGTLYGLDVDTLEVDEKVPESGGPSGVYPDPAAELDADHLVVWIPNYRDSVTRIDLAASSEGEPSPIGPNVQVASGKLSGRSWTLQAFLTEEGLCMALDSALSCGPSRSGLARPKSPILVVFANTSYESEQEFDGTWLYGVVSPEVAELEVVTEGGVAIPVSIVEKDIGLSVRFYVVALERAPSGGTLIARGADGSVLQEHEVQLP